jgi:hypothetical protein
MLAPHSNVSGDRSTTFYLKVPSTVLLSEKSVRESLKNVKRSHATVGNDVGACRIRYKRCSVNSSAIGSHIQVRGLSVLLHYL